jgi:hypothetical protein
MKHPELSAHRQIAILVLSFVLSLTLAGPLLAKSETVKMTITGTNLPKPIEITDRSILSNLNIWIGPGTSINGVPDTRNGPAADAGGKRLREIEPGIRGRAPDRPTGSAHHFLMLLE